MTSLNQDNKIAEDMISFQTLCNIQVKEYMENTESCTYLWNMDGHMPSCDKSKSLFTTIVSGEIK